MAGGGIVSDRGDIRKLAFVGFAGLLIGIGLCRFAYTPLVPVMIGEGWVTPAEAGYLGAINFAGYFLGAATAWALAQRAATGLVVRANLVLCIVSLAAAALPLGFYWLAFWRLAAGYGGAVIMVLAVPAVLAQIPAGRWGAVSGIMLAGVGAGLAAAGTIVPLLAQLGASEAWTGLALVALLSGGFMHKFWREPSAEGLGPPAGEARAPLGLPAILLLLSYGAYAIGMAPHSVFWVDYLARGLGLGIAMGGVHWTVLGLMAVAAPAVTGQIADRFPSYGKVLSAGLAVLGLGVLVPVVTDAPAAQFVSTILFGALFTSVVVLFASRAAEIKGRHGQRRLWWQMTLFFSMTQAFGIYGFSELFDATGAYLPLFAIAGALMILAAALAAPALARLVARQK